MIVKFNPKKITKKKNFVLFSVIVILAVTGYSVLSNNSPAKAKEEIVNPKEQTEIQSVIQEFIQTEARKEVKSREEVMKEAREILKHSSTDSFSKNYIEGIVRGEIKVPLITECYSNLSFGETERLEKNRISIKATEDRVCKYNDGSDTEGIYPHFFTLVKKENKWRVEKFEDGSIVRGQPASDDRNSPLENLTPEELMEEQTIQLWRMNDVSLEEIRSIEKMKEKFPGMKVEYEKPKDTDSQEASITSASYYSYNRSNAAWYGSYYAVNPNSSFRDFTYSGGDCTNFISQAIWYGNWPMTGWWPDKYSTSVWWYSFSNWQGQSYTWTSAERWFWFTYNRPRGYLTSNGCNLQKGDIVQRDKSQDGKINMDHSLIVTDVKPSCDIRVSYHTPNTRDRSLWDFMKQYPGAVFYGWRLFNSAN